MEGFTLAVILVTILINIASEHTNQAIRYGLTAFINYLKRGDKPVNQDLKKALKRSFFAALQNIAWDCHKELYPHKFMGVWPIYPSKHRDELKWLDQKCQQLAKALSEQFKAETVDESPFVSLTDIEVLLNSDNPAKTELTQKLVSEALKEETSVPACYEEKVRTELFERVWDHFVWEIKYNSVVYNILSAQLLAKINTQLAGQQVAMQHLVRQSIETVPDSKDEATITIKLDLDIKELSPSQLFAILDNLQQGGKNVILKIQRLETGCVTLVLEGSHHQGKQIEKLFQSGQLAAILGISVQDVRVNLSLLSPSAHPLTQLSQWFTSVIDISWQTLEDLLGARQLAFRTAVSKTQTIKRAKRLAFNVEQTVALVVELSLLENHEIHLHLQVHPIEPQTKLPENLTLILLSETGEPLDKEIRTGNHENRIGYELTGKSGERFSVKLVLEEISIVEYFMI